MDEALLGEVVIGFSCRRYRESAEMILEAFGLGSSRVSKRNSSKILFYFFFSRSERKAF